MLGIFSQISQYRRFHQSKRAIKILTISDTLFFSGMEIAAIVFGIFVVNKIPGATVIELGYAHALFFLAVALTEPLLSNLFDTSPDYNLAFNGFVIGNLFKAIARIVFIFLANPLQLYILFFALGIIHSIGYPSFAKLFTKHLDKGMESFEWGFKDSLLSFSKVFICIASGYVVVLFGYSTLFVVSSILMLIFGVIIPIIYKKDLVATS